MAPAEYPGLDEGKKTDSGAAAVNVAHDALENLQGLKPSDDPQLEAAYVWPEGLRPDVLHDKFDFELPVVDLSPLIKLDKLRKEANLRSGILEEIQVCEAAKADIERVIREACQEYGFFQVVNHDFPIELVEQLADIFRQIFALPLEVTKGLTLPT